MITYALVRAVRAVRYAVNWWMDHLTFEGGVGNFESMLVPKKLESCTPPLLKKKIPTRSVIEAKKVCYTEKRSCIRMHTHIPKINLLVHVNVRIKIRACTKSPTPPKSEMVHP